MYLIRDHGTGDLFDPFSGLGQKRRNLLAGSWAGVFREHLLTRLPVREVAKHFDAATGRPTKDLHVALGVLILQQLHDLTDTATVEALAFNLAWHFALDVRDETDAYLCEKTLRNYRRLVIDQGLDAVLFRDLTDQLIKAFGVDPRKQRLDSTAIRSAMRTLTRLGIVVETIAKFLRELACKHPALAAMVDTELTRKYVDREGPGCFAAAVPSESKLRLPEAGADLLALSIMFEPTEAAELSSFRILQRVLAEQFEVEEVSDQPSGCAKIRAKEGDKIPSDSVQSPTDPDASYNTHRGQGYMAQVMETYQEDDDPSRPVAPRPDLITHVAVHKMTVHDGDRLAPALADVQERDAAPAVLLGDSHYGSNENVKAAKEQGVDLRSPSMTAKGSKQHLLTLEQFDLNDRGLVTRCPAGQAPISVSSGECKLQVRFDETTCSACPVRQQCPTRSCAERGEGRRYQYTSDRVRQRTRRLAEQTDAFRDMYRWRAGAEGTISRLKHQMGVGRLRVRGLDAVTHRVRLRALGLNILRCAAFHPA